MGADLRGAHLEKVSLRRADVAGTEFRSSSVRYADLRGAKGLSQFQLVELIGNKDTLLPTGPSDAGEPFYVWSCWKAAPLGFDTIVASAAGPLADDAARAALRAEFLCGPGNPRLKTGAPLALDAPYPEGHPLANRSD